MARYEKGGKYDIRDVHQVARLYNQLWRDYSGFSHPNRPSDYDLWRMGKPAIHTRGTISEGEARLEMTFQNFTEEEAEQWAKRYIRNNKVPYTSIEVKPATDLRGLLNFDEDEDAPSYVRVIVKFEMHPDYRDEWVNP